MSGSAAYASTPNTKSTTTNATADTSLTAPTHATSAFTAGANGSKVEEISIMQIATTAAAGILNIFLHDGTNYHFYDQYTFAAVTLSTTSEAQRQIFQYPNLILPNGWTIQHTVTTTAGQSAFKVTIVGGDF